MRRRAVLAALVGLSSLPAGTLPTALAGCTSTPTLPLPPPVVSLGLPSLQGLVVVEGVANPLAYVHVLNQVTDQGKIARASELGAFRIELEARSGDTLVVWQERDGDSGERSEHVVPTPTP
jgi:hypothetical protein